MTSQKTVQILLRISISIVFLYAAIAATLQPYNWIGFIPQFARALLPASILLTGFSLYQVLLSGWILSGWKIKYAALLSAITFLAIILVNISQLDILFRDFAIFFASLALIFTDSKKY